MGIAALIASFFFYQHEMFAFGGGFIGFGTMALVLGIVQLLSKPETHKATEIEETDERNQAIRGKAAYATNMIMLVCLAVACILYMQIDQPNTAFVFFGLLIVEMIAQFTAKKVYERKM